MHDRVLLRVMRRAGIGATCACAEAEPRERTVAPLDALVTSSPELRPLPWRAVHLLRRLASVPPGLANWNARCSARRRLAHSRRGWTWFGRRRDTRGGAHRRRPLLAPFESACLTVYGRILLLGLSLRATASPNARALLRAPLLWRDRVIAGECVGKPTCGGLATSRRSRHGSIISAV